jgi:hypothetical protein
MIRHSARAGRLDRLCRHSNGGNSSRMHATTNFNTQPLIVKRAEFGDSQPSRPSIAKWMAGRWEVAILTQRLGEEKPSPLKPIVNVARRKSSKHSMTIRGTVSGIFPTPKTNHDRRVKRKAAAAEEGSACASRPVRHIHPIQTSRLSNLHSTAPPAKPYSHAFLRRLAISSSPLQYAFHGLYCRTANCFCSPANAPRAAKDAAS